MTRPGDPNGDRAREFRARFTRPLPRITCIGVWDTVGSLGIPTTGPIGRRTRQHYAFHDVQLGGIVDNAFQAMAIDEHRGPFSPAVWESADAHHDAGQRLEQMWFPGSHVNVGGGFYDTGLSDAALQWMGERASACALDIDTGRLGATPRFDAELCDSYSPLYRALDWLTGQRRIDRAIGREPQLHLDGDTYRTHEDVSAFARSRLDDFHGQPPYRPANLTAYLNRPGLATATPS